MLAAANLPSRKSLQTGKRILVIQAVLGIVPDSQRFLGHYAPVNRILVS